MSKVYLTNTPLCNRERCIQAAQRSGLPITFEDEPMPVSAAFDTMAYRREPLIGVYGCVVLNGGEQDCSAFWDHWDALA